MKTWASMMSCTLAYCLANPGTSVYITDAQFAKAIELQTSVPEWAEKHGVSAIRSGDGYKIVKEVE